MVVNTFNPKHLRDRGRHSLKANLLYRVSVRKARAIQRNVASKYQKNLKSK